MKIKVAEATNPQLDWLAAKAQGLTEKKSNNGLCKIRIDSGRVWIANHQNAWRLSDYVLYAPSTDPADGHPIIEREIDIMERRAGYFYANRFKRCVGRVDTNFKSYPDEEERFAYGPTMLIAGLRCLIAAKMGDEVDVPEVLA